MTRPAPEPLRIRAGRAFTPTEVIPDAAVLVEDGRIAAVGPDARVPSPPGVTALDAGDRILAPGFIDLHVHGRAGHACGASAAETLAVAAALPATGVTSFLATVAGQPDLDALLRALAAAAEARGREGTGARVLGVHAEGPFLSPARRGAHPPETLRPPSPAHLERMLEAARGSLRLVTLAPELPGALDLVRALAARDVVAAAGHTDATYEEAAAAFDAGVTYATHTFNAMRGLTARDPGAAGAVLVRDGVRAEVIADGRHVHPAAVALLVRAKGPEGVILVTDNVPPAGLPDGRYGRGGRAVTVAGGAALLPDGTLAGSTTPMHRMVANAARFAGVPLHTAVAMATRNPAAALGLEGEVGSLAPGRIADLVVLDAELTVHLTVVGGRVAYRSAALAEVAP